MIDPFNDDEASDEKLSSLDNNSNFNSILNINDRAEVKNVQNLKSKLNITRTKTNLDRINKNLTSFYLANEEMISTDLDENHIDNSNQMKNSSRDVQNRDQNNGIELDTVKHKISNLWNNVKYGWSNYMKKTNKLEFNRNEAIFIMGKRFNLSLNTDNNESLHDTSEISLSKFGNSSFYFYNENDKMPSLDINYSFINPNDCENVNNKCRGAVKKTNENEISSEKLKQYGKVKSLAENDNDYLSMTYSYLSSSSLFSSIISKSPSSDSIYNTRNKLTNDNMKTPLEQEIYSRLWFTYRKDFEPLSGNTNYTSDCGWGCMLRTAQMLIAQGLLVHTFGKDWSLYKSLKSDDEINIYKDLISLFNDRNSESCPFGIHNLLNIADKKLVTEINEKSNKTTRVGTWFGPSAVCILMKEALNKSLDNPLLQNIRFYVAQDCTIYKQDILNICCSKNENFIPCIILVSVRLGGESINEIYIESLKAFFRKSNCIGMIGGKPKHSLYFIGYQGDRVIYLDPHICQPTVNIYSSKDQSKSIKKTSSSLPTSYHEEATVSSSSSDLFDNTSFHCTNPNRIYFSKLDPSLAIGFYIKTIEDLNEFCKSTIENSSSDLLYPMFGISDLTFEQTQLNYEMFSLDEKVMPNNVKGECTSNHSQSCMNSKQINQLDLSDFAKYRHTASNGSKHSTNKSSKFNKSGSLSVLNRHKKSHKKTENDDFVLV